MPGFHYRLTDAGRAAWEEQDTAVPAEYRRLLWMMDVQGEGGVADKLAALYPPDMLEEWLGELEEIGLIERIAEARPALHPTQLRERSAWTRPQWRRPRSRALRLRVLARTWR